MMIMEKKCADCERYRRQIADMGIESFLLTHIQNGHLAEVLLDFFVKKELKDED